jgi:hypothetical protein
MLLGAEVLSRLPGHVRGRGLLWGRRRDDRTVDELPTRDEERDDAPAHR